MDPQLTSLLDIPPRDLPMIWDADFMLGPPDADGADSYVLGEINVSSVFPIPEEASAAIAHRVAARLRSKFPPGTKREGEPGVRDKYERIIAELQHIASII